MRRLILSILLFSFLTTACDTPGVAPVDLTFQVRIQDRDDGEPQAGVKIVVMDPAMNRLVAVPRLSGVDGLVEFTGLKSGTYALLVFPARQRGVFRQPGEFQLGGIEVLDKDDPAPVFEVVTFREPGRFADSLPRFSGTVVDAVTGDPLPGAFIGFASLVDLYSGYYSPAVDVSGADGTFHVAAIPVTQNPLTENLIQVAPLMVQCEGFEPLAWRHHFSNGDDNLDVVDARVELQRIGSTRGTGNLSGQLFFQDEPVAGLDVSLSYFDDPQNPFGAEAYTLKSGVGVPGLTVKSDAEGRFLLRNIPAGRYLLHPGYRLGDGYLPYPSEQLETRIIADSTLVLAPLQTLVAIEAVWPLRGSTIRTRHPLLEWKISVDVDSFRVFLGYCYLGATTGKSLEVPDACNLQDGNSWFNVNGYAQGRIVATIEELIEFRIRLDVD